MNSTSRIHEFNFMNSQIQLHEFYFTNSASRIQLHEFTNSTSRIQLQESTVEFMKLKAVPHNDSTCNLLQSQRTAHNSQNEGKKVRYNSIMPVQSAKTNERNLLRAPNIKLPYFCSKLLTGIRLFDAKYIIPCWKQTPLHLRLTW